MSAPTGSGGPGAARDDAVPVAGAVSGSGSGAVGAAQADPAAALAARASGVTGETGPPSTPPAVRHRRRWTPSRVLVTAALVAATVVFVYPFVWLVSASFKPRSQVFDNRLLPQDPTLATYVQVWDEAPLLLWLGNTLLVTVLAATAVTVSSALVAWGFSYFRFRFRGALFALVLATMMLPGAVTMIPTFLIWNSLGLTDSLVPLWAGNLFGSAFYIFLLRQFFLGLPREVFEAATIDGADNWQLFWRMALPLTKPAVVVTLLFEFQAAWTDLMRPLIYLRSSENFTVPRGLKTLVDTFGAGGEFQWQVVITASVITTVPMVVLFFLGQKHFVAGIATSGTTR
ncbi:multiple sugar transport system permease protein [Pseudokineococcus lusitanus]|uniref:Multiple sugar transport system permease protein n=1 Tax=Pseudokineococcus lusitanus TaxID=763993 RepID=A0A3N1G8J0_9ACTN|nr:carbohydrate ABC transporter permease [Pseudokineococcus lusitanus]ROP26543.1 multiple sugar transport system permease protein [Pseudokineococcus lusitanus]